MIDASGLSLQNVVRARLPSPRAAAVCGEQCGAWLARARSDVPLMATAITLTVLLSGCGSLPRRHSSAAIVGVIAQLGGTQGCVVLGGAPGCSKARPPGLTASVAVSRDGHSAYVTSDSGSGAVAVFQRDLASGALVQLAGRAGCVIRVSGSGCAQARSIRGASSVVVSPDARNAYVTASRGGGVAVFRRNRQTGGLTQLHGRDGCVTPPRHDGCAHDRALYGSDAIAVSPDGRNVYVASRGEAGVVVFKRDRRRGTLAPLAGNAGCVTADPFRGCALGRALFEPASVVVSPDGRNVYVAAFASDAVAAFTRDPATGALTQSAGKAGCVSIYRRRRCARGRALYTPSSIALSPDGRSLYASSFFDHAVVLLRRDPATGALTEPAGTRGCVSSSRRLSCARARALDQTASVVVSADGRSVYVTSSSSEGNGAVAVFTRNRSDGTLTQPAGALGCLNEGGAEGCTQARALHYAGRMALSPDDRNAYVASFASSGAVAAFARRVPR